MNIHTGIAADTGDTACTEDTDDADPYIGLDAFEMFDSLSCKHDGKFFDCYESESPRSLSGIKIHSVLGTTDASTQTDLSFVTNLKSRDWLPTPTQTQKRRFHLPLRSDCKAAGVYRPKKWVRVSPFDPSPPSTPEGTSNNFELINAMLARHADARDECVDGLPRNLL